MKITYLNKNQKGGLKKESRDYKQYKKLFLKSFQGGLSNKIKEEYKQATRGSVSNER